LAVIGVALVAGLIIARTLLVPETFGKYGHYRADAVDEARSQELVYAGADVCYECHDDIFDLKAESHHRGVSCEVCHGPAAEHTEDPDEFSPNLPTGRDACLICHSYNPSRPSGFPQVLAERHNPGRTCMSCHDAHEPSLPSAISECSACHRDIANVKVVSHHAVLECSVCHQVPEEHMADPRFVRAAKPTDNSTCAVCHQRGSDVMTEYDPPKIDVESHTDRYLCWDCHYPHFPEARI
jgi:hypothetical protein